MKLKRYLVVLLALLTFGCVKNHPQTGSAVLSSAVAQARQYFNDSILSSSTSPTGYQATIGRKVDWEHATAAKLPFGEGVWVPLEYSEPLFVRTSFSNNNYFNLDNLSQLLVYKDKKGVFHAEVVTRYPDSIYINDPIKSFTGYVFVEDWWGNTISRYLFEPAGVKKYIGSPVQSQGFVQYCTVIFGYNYSKSTANDGYSYVQSAGCYMAYEPDTDGNINGGGGSGIGYGQGLEGGGGVVKLPNPDMFIGQNIILNIQEYFRCFQDVSGAAYQVKVCVDQPKSGSRTPWSFSLNSGSSSGSNPVNTGHSFLIFSETIGGNTTTRNVGFYPSQNLNPFTGKIESPGALNNDESHSYNISGAFQISGPMFFSMLNFVAQGNRAGYNYNLSTNNCTSFVINALAAGHIYLPSTIGYWTGGLGNDPGDFGEDLRNSNAPGILKSTSETSHSNLGSCN